MQGGGARKAEKNGSNNSLRGKEVNWNHMRVKAADEVKSMADDDQGSPATIGWWVAWSSCLIRGDPVIMLTGSPLMITRVTGEEIVLTKCMSAGEKGPLVTAATLRAPTLYA